MNGRVTVVGARGFVGSAVVAHARALGAETIECRHDDVPRDVDLGLVAYCSGVAYGADKHPLDAYRLHVAAVAELAATRRYERIVYLSSTRVYDRSDGTNETGVSSVRSDAAGDTYALSKLAGEGVVLQAGERNRVVRASNIYGASLRSRLFLSDILRQAAATGRIELRSSLESSKDYVSVDDVAAMLLAVGAGSRERIYNVAAGENVAHGALLEAILPVLPAQVRVAPGSPTVTVPRIDIARVSQEFAFEPRRVLDDLPRVAREFEAAFRA